MHTFTKILIWTSILVVAIFLFYGVNKAQADPATGGIAIKNKSVKVQKVTLTKNGKATIPTDAPKRVKRVIRAANRISHTPYVWGGGHGRWKDIGYDCSGSVSYALRGGNLLSSPKTSGSLASWGKAGHGKWITVYANSGHVWMKFRGGIKFDTSGASPSRWQKVGNTSSSGYTIRHPKGL
jgi:hypothetical protein